MRTQPLICVGCSVHYCVSHAIHKEGFFWDCIFVVDTHLPRFEALAYVLPHFDALTHVVILVSTAFIFQRFADVWYSVFVKRLSIKKFAVKLYFGLSLHIFQHSSLLSLENVCNSWCMHQTGFSSAAVVSQSKSTELCSSAAVVPQRKSTEMWSSAAPFDHDLWYFRDRTNEHFYSMLLIGRNL